MESMNGIKICLLSVLCIFTINCTKSSQPHGIADTCLQDVIRHCPDLDQPKLDDKAFLEQIANDPIALKFCGYLRCIKNQEPLKNND